MKRIIVRLALIAGLGVAVLSAVGGGATLAVQHINGNDSSAVRIVAVQHINDATVTPDVQHIN